MILHDFQEKHVTNAIDFFDHGGRSLVIQSPTGTGKSVVAKAFIHRKKLEKKRVYFLTHSRQLLRQFSEHLDAIGVRHGIIAPGYPVLGYSVQVISVQSLASKYQQLPAPDWMIFEECHHAPANIFKRTLDYWPDAKLLGLTATPQRADGTPLDMFEHMLTSPSVRWFIDQGYLCDFDYFVPADLDTRALHHQMGDFNKKELAEINREKSRVKSFVSAYEEHARGKSGIAFGVDIADSERIAAEFAGQGWPMKALHSKIKNVDQILRELVGGGLISSCDLIGEGVDIQGLSCEIDARPTESLTIKLQHSGRVLRAQYAKGHDLSTRDGRLSAMQESGKRAVILDMSSNYLRHGLPDQERQWNIHGIKIDKGEATLKRCPGCERPIVRTLMICNFCGHIFQKKTMPPREIEEREGQMIKLRRDTAEQALIRDIARNAQNIGQAMEIAARNEYNVPSKDVYKTAREIWEVYLKNKPIDRVGLKV